MKINKISLDKLPLNKEANVMQISCEGDIKRRLMDIGLVKGTKITPVFTSPFNDPRAYLIRGSVIAIRSDEAKDIFVVNV